MQMRFVFARESVVAHECAVNDFVVKLTERNVPPSFGLCHEVSTVYGLFYGLLSYQSMKLCAKSMRKRIEEETEGQQATSRHPRPEPLEEARVAVPVELESSRRVPPSASPR